MMKRFLLLLCLLLPWAAALGQPVKMTASVNKTSLTTDDELVLTVTVDGAAGDFMPQLPSLPAFNVYARSSTTQINNFHTLTTFDYVMLPRFAGNAVIGPVTLHYRNKTYQTDPIRVTVYRAAQAPKKAASSAKSAAKAPAAPPPAPANLPPLERALYNQAARNTGKNYFMVAALSNANPYVNQTVTLAVRFYYARPFVDNAPYTAPSITNLFMEDIGSADGRQTLGNKVYAYTEKRYALSGVTAGKAEVGPASVKYIPAGRLDLSMFDAIFAVTGGEADVVQSNTLTLNIRPVPQADQPKSFYGAVGSGYTISASVDRDKVEAGEAVNLTVKLNGTGNLKPTADLRLPALAGFKMYDVASSSGAVNANGALKSYKIFKAVIVPSSSGEYTIPALAWSYFDPSAKEYRTLYTRPITLQVSPSTKVESGFDFGAQAGLGNGFKQLGRDIRYLKSDVYRGENTFFAALAGLSFINYLALTLLVLAGVFALMDKNSLADKRALSKARAQLKKAKTEEETADALSAYLRAKYGVSTGSLPLRDISAALRKRGVSPAALALFENLWQRLNAARFAPAGAHTDAQELTRQSAALVKELEKGGPS